MPHKAHDDSPRRRWAARAWLAAGLLGTTFAVTVALSGVLDMLPLVARALMSALAGWLAIILFAPWRAVLEHREDHRRLRRLATRISRALEAEERRLDELPAAHRDDEIGRLSSAVHGVLHEVASGRARVRKLERRMGDSIQRETHRRTVRLERAAFTDPLTGLGNRRALDARLADLVSDPDPGPVTALLVDVDRFKKVNDTLGHEVGDTCLVFLGDLLRTAVRAADTPVRLGGDEFLVLMPDQTVAHAQPVAERLRRLYQQMPWRHRDIPRPTLSIGLAALPAGARIDGPDLLRRADEALYRAKRQGRARVVAWEAG